MIPAMRCQCQTSGLILCFTLIACLANAQVVSYQPLITTSIPAIDLSKPVGTIEGSAGVSSTGAATYTIPIKVAPGTKGMEPQLSLTYNSQRGNGIMGWGWSLSGLSAITRSGLDNWHNGNVSPVSVSNADHFLLDGMLLIASGTNGANRTTYSTDVETYSVTTSYGTFGSGPQWFKVWMKDGSVLEYGNTADSRIVNNAGTDVLLWKQPATISENGSQQILYYGHDYERRKTELYSGPVLQETRYYMGGGAEKHIDAAASWPSGTKDIYYIPGPDGIAAIIYREGGDERIYYPYTDHLGSIQALTNETGTVVYEQAFDAWGRQRDPATWTIASDGDLIIPSQWAWLRGYTGHEHIPSFHLINMNGRVYDPLMGRMLNPDDYVQESDYSQSYNRYSYCFNNPVKYTDPSGEVAFFDDAILGLIGGGINLLSNWDNIHSFSQGLKYFGVGFGGGVLSEYISPIGSAALVGAGNAAISSYDATGHIDPGAMLEGAVTSAVMAGITMGVGNAVGPGVNQLLSGVASPVLRGALQQALTGAVVGGAIGGLSASLSGEDVLNGASDGAIWGGSTGLATGAYQGYKDAKRLGFNPWTGNKIPDVLPGLPSAPFHKLDANQISGELLKAGFVEKTPQNAPLRVFQLDKVKVRLDPPQGKTPYNHMHIEFDGRFYDINRNCIDPVTNLFYNNTHPNVHIKIR